MRELIADCDHFVAGAARIGGISYFHEYAYDLLAENERILAASFDAAIWAHREKKLPEDHASSRSSMVFENATVFPTPEGHQLQCAPPSQHVRLSKARRRVLRARGANEQYKLPYTIVRPFNCVGIGERRALGGKEIFSGNVQLAMSHVVPDLVQKVLKGQDPLHILGDGNQVRHYTYGGDLAQGHRGLHRTPCCAQRGLQRIDGRVEHGARSGEGDLGEGPQGSAPLPLPSDDKPFEYDVQRRVPDVRKTKETVLGFEATTSLATRCSTR